MLGLDDEGADLSGLLLAVGHGGDDVRVRHAGIGDEALSPLSTHSSPSRVRAGPGAARIAPRAGFRQAVRADDLARGHRPQVTLLLLVRPRDPQRVAAKRRVRGDDDADAAAGSRELLDRDRVGETVEAGATDLLRVRHAEQPEPGGLADDLHRELALALELIGDRADAPLGKVAHGRADRWCCDERAKSIGWWVPRLRIQCWATSVSLPGRHAERRPHSRAAVRRSVDSRALCLAAPPAFEVTLGTHLGPAEADGPMPAHGRRRGRDRLA